MALTLYVVGLIVAAAIDREMVADLMVECPSWILCGFGVYAVACDVWM